MQASIGVLIFGVLVVAAEIYVMVRRDKGWGRSNKQMVGLTLVIVAGLFLISGGFTQTDSAPMFGILGAIAGYLFGAGTDAGSQ
jgi:hypothetical protein